ncbi:hypothetical protein Tco_1262578 [Tanacetum coccineum]
MEIPDTMIDKAFKKSIGYKYYRAKKAESKKAKDDEEPEEQHVSPVISGRGKVYVFRDDETDDSDNSDMDLSDNEPKGDDDATGFGVFVYNKSTEPLIYTYLSPTVTTSSLEYMQSLLNETPTNELMDYISNLVYTNAQTTSAVVYPEGNPELTSYISDNSLHFISTSKHTSQRSPTKLTLSQNKEAYAKGKKNMRKIKFKWAVALKFKEYDQKLEALTSINVSEAIDKAVHVKVLTEMKNLIPTHVLKVLANYVNHCLNNYVLEVMKNNQISLFTKPSTSADDLSNMDLKLQLLNKIHKNKTHPTNQKLYDTLYKSIILDQEVVDAQKAETSFHKRSHGRFTKKSGSADAAKRRTTWFDLILKLDIDQNENYILGPSTVAIEKKLKGLIQKDELTIADLEGAGLEKLKRQYKNDVELKYHIDQLKAAVSTEGK